MLKIIIQKSKKAFRKVKKYIKKISLRNFILGFIGFGMLMIGGLVVWASLLQLPDFQSFTQRKIQSSTKIYDRTGTIVLYDVHQDIKRTIIPYESIGVNVKNATVAIEDSEFYKHKGIRLSSIFRATVWAKLTGKKIQGGSTITQQLIKNTLLNSDRTFTRKVKEWILALKLEKTMNKENILALYLNEAPYGGNIYGIEEASQAFFGKAPLNLTLAESAYIAAIPNAPTYYSPYGKHVKELNFRKNLVLKRMFDLKFITKTQYDEALNEKVVFLPSQPLHIAAPHFVFYIKDYLEKKYGEEMLDIGGLKVVTTLDYDIQLKAEKFALARSKENEKKWNGKNAAIVVLDPKTGQILAMVGSRDYFDKSVDGNFNVTTALRQPGSSFKPIVYALAFQKGYTADTTLFDVKTEFNSSCSPLSKPLPGNKKATCYSPDDFDNFKYGPRGPMTLKNALAQSINIIAVKLLYLVSIPDAIKMAHDLGISTLNDPTRYGLSLVIGGGETTLLDMTSVYGVFANTGVRNPTTGILSVEDSSGILTEKYEDKSYKVLDSNITKILSDILSDNVARAPTFTANSVLVVPGHEVAVKTGTTNNNRDALTIGYTPSVAVGVWVGNNDNKSMKNGGVALAGPLWNDVMKAVLTKYPVESFEKPDSIDPSLPPILRGFWQGENLTDTTTGASNLFGMPVAQPATNIHTILYWINKDNPLGPRPINPEKDPQYTNWEYAIQKYLNSSYGSKYKTLQPSYLPTASPQTTSSFSKPTFTITGLQSTPYKKTEPVSFTITPDNVNQINKIDIYVNNSYITSLKASPWQHTFTPNEINGISSSNTLRIVSYDASGATYEQSYAFLVSVL